MFPRGNFKQDKRLSACGNKRIEKSSQSQYKQTTKELKKKKKKEGIDGK
jgi:hypothetical protein